MQRLKCRDCGIEEGGIHKYGCDMESCPFCGEQLIGCLCAYAKMGIDCSEGTDAYENGLTIKQEEKWLAIVEKKGRVPYIRYPHICARCGELWPEMFRVTNEEWDKYIPIEKRSEMLCFNCFYTIKQLIDNQEQKGESQNETD